MEFEAVFRSGADNSCLLAKPTTNCCQVTLTHSSDHEEQAKKALLQYCSFPQVRHHPHQAAIEALSRAWLADLYRDRLPAARVNRLLDTRLDTLGCVLYPHGSSDARSLTLNKLTHWFFVLDDVLDDPHLLGHKYEAARGFACRLFRVMFSNDMTAMVAMGLASGDHYDGGEPADNSKDQESQQAACAVAKAQQDLVIEVGAQWVKEMGLLGMSSRQLERLRLAVAEYLAGIVGIVRLRQEKRLPSLDEYIRLRRMDGAGKLALLGCEFDVGIELDNETLEHPLIKELNATTADQLLWLNDLLSLNREYHNEDYVSLVPVLHYNSVQNSAVLTGTRQGRTGTNAAQLAEYFYDAISAARAMIKAVDKERVWLAAKIIAWRPDLKPYVEATHSTITGNTFWTLWSQRYQKRGPI